jgi:hypothetical protein
MGDPAIDMAALKPDSALDGHPPSPVRAFQWDLARQVERLDWLVAQLPRLADWGYQELYLHLEDAVEYPSLPGVARKDAYSHRELGSLVRVATQAGLGVVPIVNLLGHTQYLIKVPGLRDLNECRAPDGSPLPQGQVCPLHPRMAEIAGKLLGDVAEFCTAGKVHVGLDESYNLGRHPLSRAEIENVGLAAHFAGYVQRLHAQVMPLGLRLGLWADMLALLPEAIGLLPSGVIAYDWYYHPFRGKPRLEVRNFAEYDLTPGLRRRGIEYWGCPMAGSFRHEPLPIFRERLGNIIAWWNRCIRTRAAGFLLTSWEPRGLAAELPMAVAAAAAGLWIENESDPRRLWELGCRRAFGKQGRASATRLWDSDRKPFCGYPRWQVNDRWDTAVTDEPVGPWRREAQFCAKLAVSGKLPPAVSASLRFRAYLAERDLFVRQAGKGVISLRRAGGRSGALGREWLLAALQREARAFSRILPAARTAARAMWRRTRDPGEIGPNERMLAADGRRLKEWEDWLRGCRPRAGSVWKASPVAGKWQLIFTVTDEAPAQQKVVVERLGRDGAWEEIYGLFLIEFLARAAHPRARLRYRLSVPVAWAGLPAPPPRLRICARGFGRLKLGRPILTNGAVTFTIQGGGWRTVTLGRPAPKRAFPDFDWAKNRGAWEPAWKA